MQPDVPTDDEEGERAPARGRLASREAENELLEWRTCQLEASLADLLRAAHQVRSLSEQLGDPPAGSADEKTIARIRAILGVALASFPPPHPQRGSLVEPDTPRHDSRKSSWSK